METFQKAVEHEFSAVNQLIVDRLQSDVGLVESIGHYIVDAGGMEEAVAGRQEEPGVDLLKIVVPTGRRYFGNPALILAVGW